MTFAISYRLLFKNFYYHSMFVDNAIPDIDKITGTIGNSIAIVTQISLEISPNIHHIGESSYMR